LSRLCREIERSEQPAHWALLSRAVSRQCASREKTSLALLRGFSGAVIGGRYIAYIGFDSPGDANRAAGIIEEAEALVV
jgi:hypothetical protein